MTERSTRADRRRIVASVGVIGVAAAVAGLSTFGTFTDSDSTFRGVQRDGAPR